MQSETQPMSPKKRRRAPHDVHEPTAHEASRVCEPLRTVPEALLSRPVTGVNLPSVALREWLAQRTTLLVFLRHFGCLFCREVVRDLRAAAEANPKFPSLLFFYQGTREQGRRFFGEHWPDAPAVSDETKFFYRGFGLRQGGVQELAGRGIWTAGLRAMLKGNRIGMPVGDPLLMPGYFLVRDAQILWQDLPQLASDHPDFSKIAGLADAE